MQIVRRCSCCDDIAANKRGLALCLLCRRQHILDAYNRYDISEKGRTRSKKYDKSIKGREKIKLGIERYRHTLNGKERHLAAQRRYDATPAGKASLTRNKIKRLARIGVKNTLTGTQWQVILEKYECRCAYCDTTGKMTIDHVIPLALGGHNTAENVVPACSSCNKRKFTKLIKPPERLTGLETWARTMGYSG